MSGNHTDKALFGAIKGMLFMRIQELTTKAAIIRSAVIFLISFVLLMLLRLDHENAVERFHGLLLGVFALKFLPIYCLTKGGESLRSELKDGTIEYLWVRPASKVELYFGFFLGGLMGAISIVGPALLGVSLAGLVHGALSLSGLLVLWTVVLFVVASYTALSGAIGAWTSKFVVLGIFYYFFVEVGLAAIPNGVQRLAVTYHAQQLLEGLSSGETAVEIGSLLWIVGIGATALVLGAAIFSQSRYVVGSEKEA